MNVLIIGSGGREHALAWKVAQDPRVQKVFVAPGNAGTAIEAKCENVAIDVLALEQLADFAEKNVSLTIVGPEVPLVAGVVDLFRSRGLDCFGPTAGAAQLEGSKAFTKDFLARHKIPTADYQNFTEIEPALAYLREKGAPIVIKADGLAAGKGVIVAMTLGEAEDAVRDMLAGNAFGEAGSRVVIEEFLDGEEASFIVMVDGKNVLPMATSQDHKRVGDADTGPNTGGMGAYSPAPVVTAQVHQRVMDLVIWPTVRGMADEGNVYTGFLYAGLMIELNSSLLFGSGDAMPSDLAFNIIDKVAAILKPFDNPIHVEGFTDNQPIQTAQYPTNWELSSARSASIVRMLAMQGVNPARMASVGYGEFQPVANNATAEGRARNRRVVLVVSRNLDVRRSLTGTGTANATPDAALKRAGTQTAPTPVKTPVRQSAVNSPSPAL